jgi:hypothetical protein
VWIWAEITVPATGIRVRDPTAATKHTFIYRLNNGLARASANHSRIIVGTLTLYPMWGQSQSTNVTATILVRNHSPSRTFSVSER